MTYARTRLWLGITGVGSIVLLSLTTLVGDFPRLIFSTGLVWTLSDLLSLLLFGCLCLVVTWPLDLIGGFFLPRMFKKHEISFQQFFQLWARGVALQATVYLVSGLLILTGGRIGGRFASVVVVAAISICLVVFQKRLAMWTVRGPAVDFDPKVASAMGQAKELGLGPIPAVVVDHFDPGFTGGIVGLPCGESLVLSRSWVSHLGLDQLTVAIARRHEAVMSGSRSRGMLLAFTWTMTGFLAASHLPGAGVTSVAELVMTCSGFTIWTFIGLLVLPTISRQATYAIDCKMIRRGVSSEVLMTTLSKIDRLQDDEPSRSKFIEAIFHPVPSLENRSLSSSKSTPFGWHSSRMMLFLSWSCLGLLSRAVHCNVGRPELWVLLPTD